MNTQETLQRIIDIVDKTYPYTPSTAASLIEIKRLATQAVYPAEKTLGQVAMEALYDNSNWNQMIHAPLPKWQDIQPEIQSAWEHAAAAAVQYWVKDGEKGTTHNLDPDHWLDTTEMLWLMTRLAAGNNPVTVEKRNLPKNWKLCVDRPDANGNRSITATTTEP